MGYILLVLASVVLVPLTFAKCHEKTKILSLYITSMALVILADWIAFGWFHLYDYHPHLLPKHLPDEALGELLSDIVFVPAFAGFLACYLPGVAGALAGTGIVTWLEVMFDRLNLFKEHGWSPWLTALGFPVYFMLNYYLWRRANPFQVEGGPIARLLRACLIFDLIGLLTLFLRGASLVATNLAVLPTTIGNQALGRFLIYVLVTVPLGYWVASTGPGPSRWRRLGATLAVLYLLDALLYWTHMQDFRAPWSGELDVVFEGLVILLAAYLQDGLYAIARNERRWRPPV